MPMISLCIYEICDTFFSLVTVKTRIFKLVDLTIEHSGPSSFFTICSFLKWRHSVLENCAS